MQDAWESPGVYRSLGNPVPRKGDLVKCVAGCIGLPEDEVYRVDVINVAGMLHLSCNGPPVPGEYGAWRFELLRRERKRVRY